MFIHAEAIPDIGQLDKDDINVFVRIGTDFRENYYECNSNRYYSTGLYPDNQWGRNQVWPSSNMLDVKLETLRDVKTSVIWQ